MTTHESSIQRDIVQRCEKLGLYCHHTPDARITGPVPGFPDLLIFGPGGLMFREIKSDLGRHSLVQLRIHKAIKNAACPECGCPQNVDTWRPDDLKSGRVEHELLIIAGDT